MKHIPGITRGLLFPACVLGCHLIASKALNLYAVIPHLDLPLHLLGGVSIAFASARLLRYMRRERWISALDSFSLTTALIALTATAAVLWELMEFAFDQVIGTNMQVSLANTMQDQFVGLLGACLAGLWTGWMGHSRIDS